MKATNNNDLPTQTGDVKVNPGNPENPDSNNWLQRTKFPTNIIHPINQKNHSSDKKLFEYLG